jgi:hypothetical protein
MKASRPSGSPYARAGKNTAPFEPNWNPRVDGLRDGRRAWSGDRALEFAAVEGLDTTKSRGAYERQYDYEKYEGTPLRQVIKQRALAPDDRMTALFSQRAAVMP